MPDVNAKYDESSLASAVSSLLGFPAAAAQADAAEKETAVINREAAASSPEDAAACRDAAEKKKRTYSPEFRAHTFRKGQSGNPKGRRKLDPEIKTQLIAGSVEAVQALRDILSDADASPKDRMAAAEIILERVYGKAVQPIDAALGGGSSEPIRFEFVGVLDEWAK